jgi:two-component system, chemotaxis family, CheB/CheR fusion protein
VGARLGLEIAFVPEPMSGIAIDPEANGSSSGSSKPHSHVTVSTQAGDSPLYVVGVGASAGGLDALEQLFAAMPVDSGMAFVVVQHLSPDFKSVMDELLGRRTAIPIHLVEDGVRVEPNHIYLIPPKKEMIISGGALLLSDKGASQELTLPIDLFFRSLAQDVGHRAVGIVLSGAGSDGARGIRDIHAAGGLVLCQDEDSASFDGMPRSARDTGVVDHVLGPGSMPDVLLEHLRREAMPDVDEPSRSSPRPLGVAAAFRLLQQAYGIDFAHYKPSTVMRRVERRIQLSRSPTIEAYLERLANDREEVDALFSDLLIGVTRFFRDADAFERLEKDVIPGIFARTPNADEIRVWVAGCATGEEAYSIAMLLHEHASRIGDGRRLRILATDVHRGSLDFASRGLYDQDKVAGVRPELLERYFDKRGATYQVSPELRQLVVFAPHNVVKDAPFTRLDLITCRNMLIYLQPVAQQKVLSLFHFALKRNGTLFLGPSENIGPLSDDFEAIDAHWRIYRKERDIRLPNHVRLPLPRPILPGVRPEGHTSGYSLGQIANVYAALLDQLLPPSLLVNERRELVHAFGGASRYLRVHDGRSSLDVFDMLTPELKVAVTGGLQRALRDGTTVTYNGLRLPVAGADKSHKLSVKPLTTPGLGEFLLVAIEEMDLPAIPAALESEMDLDEVSRDQVSSLEAELRRTKENLQATIEELETSNEELQAANEELLAANEELQSTNEELQSVNEELYTVNSEYQKKINELTELTNDMDNLLASIEVGTIFLDQQLCVRKFTPLIAETFNLLPRDIGRPIAGFTNTLNQPTLVDDLAEVLRSHHSIEREVRDRAGNWFFLRILPYRARGSVDGVAITLIDINGLKAAEDAVFRERYLLNGLMDSVPDLIYFKDASGHFVRVNKAVSQRLGIADPNEAVGKTAEQFRPQTQGWALDCMDQTALAGRPQPYTMEQHQDAQGQPLWFMSTRQPLRDQEGAIVGVLSVARDVTQQKRAEDEIRLAVRRRDEFLAILSHELRNPLAAIVNAALLLHHAGDASGTRSRGLEVIDRQSRQMTRLLDDLLEVSRVTQSKIELRRQVIDARDVLREAAAVAHERFAARQISLDVELGDEPVMVDADPARLQQVLINLLDNACKYNEPGRRCGVQLRADGGDVEIIVSDDGTGIAPELLDSIFEPFVQGRLTLDRAEGGMGVGLTLARSLVEMHGGSLAARSEGLGKGSSFVVRLQRADPLAEVTVPAPRRSSPWPRGRRVVVVEDNEDGCEMMRLLLESAGYEVFTARDGALGLELIQRTKPNTAFIDIGLPVMDGFEVARRVRSDAACEGVHLVALTGYGQASDHQDALDAGFHQHLVKPLDPEELARLLAGGSRTE